jgi:hypothetical protein
MGLGAISESLMKARRPLLSLVVAYAVAVQSLLVAFGGIVPAAPSDANAPGFVLCLHDDQVDPASPGDTQNHPGCTHCIFCFAGSHQSLAGSPHTFSHRADIEFVALTRISDQRTLPRLYAYLIAHPRGPPLPA